MSECYARRISGASTNPFAIFLSLLASVPVRIFVLRRGTTLDVYVMINKQRRSPCSPYSDHGDRIRRHSLKLTLGMSIGFRCCCGCFVPHYGLVHLTGQTCHCYVIKCSHLLNTLCRALPEDFTWNTAHSECLLRSSDIEGLPKS